MRPLIRLGSKGTLVANVYKNYSSLPDPKIMSAQVVTVIEKQGIWPMNKEPGEYLSTGKKWVKL